jgi:hypothetical protein
MWHKDTSPFKKEVKFMKKNTNEFHNFYFFIGNKIIKFIQ